MESLARLDESWVQRAYAGMGLKPLSAVWAKCEIILGLGAAAAGIRLLAGEGLLAAAGGALFVLGGYIALAGSRSHLYQSQNRQTAYLLQILSQSKEGEAERGKDSPVDCGR